nr:Uncharacterised protein [Klebsiella pneumoniae]
MKWKMVRKAVDVQEAPADQGLAPLGLVAITVPCGKMNENGDVSGQDLPDIAGMDERDLQEYLHSMSKRS